MKKNEFSGGRSPFTWYPQEYVDNVPMTDMNMRANVSRSFPGRTYRFYNGEVIYKFGHGLSYSTFSKFVISAPSTIIIEPKQEQEPEPNARAIDISNVDCQKLQFQIVIGVKNDGKMDGSHVVLIFWKPANATSLVSGTPNIQLVGFDKVEVMHGKTKNVTVKSDICKDLSIADADGKRKIVTGLHTLVLGSSSERQVKHYINIRMANENDNGNDYD